MSRCRAVALILVAGLALAGECSATGGAGAQGGVAGAAARGDHVAMVEVEVVAGDQARDDPADAAVGIEDILAAAAVVGAVDARSRHLPAATAPSAETHVTAIDPR